MATNQLAQISALNDILTPLGGRQRGQRIQADDWNALVSVLSGILGVDKTQEQVVQSGLDDNYAPKDHTHLGQVTNDWLDPSLKGTLGDSGGSVSIRSAIADFQKTIDSLTTQLAIVNATIQQQQKQIDAFGVTNLDQSNSLRGFQDRFSAVENLRTDMTGLSGQVQSITANVNTVLDLRKTLSDANGAPIDVAGIQTKVNDLEDLKSNLTGVDGTLIRLRDFELRIANVESALGVGGSGGIDSKISAAVAAAQDSLGAKVMTQVNQLGATVQASNDAANVRLASDLKTQLDSANTAIRTQLAAAEGRINGNVTTQMNVAATNIRSTVLQAAAGQTQDMLTSVPQQVQTAVAAAATDLSASLTKSLSDNLTAKLNAGLSTESATFTTQLGKVQADLSAQLASVQSTIPVLVNQSVVNTRELLSADLDKQITTRLNDFRTTMQGTINTSVDTAVTTVAGGLPQQINTEVAKQVGDLNAQINTTVASATHNIPDLVNTQTQAAMMALNIPARLTTLSAQITTQYRAELNQSIANVRAANSTDLNSAVTNLRGEIGTIRAKIPGLLTP